MFPDPNAAAPQDWQDPYAQPPRPLTPGVPPAGFPGASSAGGFQPGQDSSYGDWWRTPLPDAAFNPQLTGSGAAGMGNTNQPEADTGTTGPSAAAGRLMTGGDKMPPPPAGAAQYAPQGPQGPPPVPQPMANPAADAPSAPKPVDKIQQAMDRDKDILAKAPETPGNHWYQRLGMAVLAGTKLAPYAQQIVHPVWSEQMAARGAAEKELGTLSNAQEAQQRGAYYQQQADESKGRYMRVGTGVFDNEKGAWVTMPADKSTLVAVPIARAAAAGLDVSQAENGRLLLPPTTANQILKPDKDIGGIYVSEQEGKAAGIQPDEEGLYYIPKEGVSSYVGGHFHQPSATMTPFDAAHVQQLNHLLSQRYAVLHPNAPVSPAYQLPVNATQQDYENVEKSLAGEEGAANTVANQAASKSLRDQTLALARRAADDREAKQDVSGRAAVGKIYDPTMKSAERFNLMSKNYEDAVKNNDQQAMLSLLFNHIGMTMGEQKGARMTKDVINEAIQSRPWLQGMGAKFDPKTGVLSGVTLTPNQMREMVSNARGRLAEDTTNARSSASYAGATDDGPKRVPNMSVINYYKTLGGGSAAQALQLMKQDGWSVE